jgi:uncharacterized membrane protein
MDETLHNEFEIISTTSCALTWKESISCWFSGFLLVSLLYVFFNEVIKFYLFRGTKELQRMRITIEMLEN